MRLPTANPARGVQTLGREDIYAPQRVASAQARAADYEGQGLKALGASVQEVADYLQKRADQEAVNEYNNAYARAQAEAERAMGVISGPTMDVSTPGMEELTFNRTVSVPDNKGGSQEVEVTSVPTYEVGGQWLTGQLNGIRESALSNIKDRRAREKFSAQWAMVEAKAHTTASGMMRKQRNTAMRGGIELNVTRFVRAGDEDSAKAQIHQGIASGVIDGEEGAKMLLDVESRIDQTAALSVISTGTDEELDGLIETIPAEGRMTVDDRRTLMNAAITERKRRATEQKARVAEWRQANSRAATNAILAGELTVEDLLANPGRFPASELRSLVAFAEKREDRRRSEVLREDKESADNANRYWTIEVQSLQSAGLEPGTDLEDARREMRDRIIADASLEPEDLERLLGKLDDVTDTPFKSTEMDMVEEQMALVITGASKEVIGLNNTSEHAARFARAREDLYTAAAQAGGDFRPHQWWRENKAVYLNRTARRTLSRARTGGAVDSRYVASTPEGDVDVPATRENLKAKATELLNSTQDLQPGSVRMQRTEEQIRNIRRQLRALDEVASSGN